MSEKNSVQIQGVKINRDVSRDGLTWSADFPCLPNVEGGCGIARRATLHRFIAPIYTAPGGTPRITMGGFRCDLGRDANKHDVLAAKGCDSSPSIYVDLELFDDNVQVIQNRDGSTTFRFK